MDNKKITLCLAPLAGPGDRAFRTICADGGAEHFTSEMISAKAIFFGDKKTLLLADFSEKERPFFIQIFGHEPEEMAYAAKLLWDKFSPDGIDINMGCPVPKITKGHDGSALMKNSALVYEIVSRVSDSVKIPVSVKIRSGWDENSINAVEVALSAQRGGAARVCVHGKTKAQLYKPGVNYDIIREVKNALKIPVIANGEIDGYESAKKMVELTGCENLMIGRAALGKPWIFNEIKYAFLNKPLPEIDKKSFIKKHIDLCFEFKPQTAAKELRMHMCYYLKGFSGAAKLRDKAAHAQTREDLLLLAESL